MINTKGFFKKNSLFQTIRLRLCAFLCLISSLPLFTHVFAEEFHREKYYLHKKDSISTVLQKRGCKHLWGSNGYLIEKVLRQSGYNKNVSARKLRAGNELQITFYCDENGNEIPGKIPREVIVQKTPPPFESLVPVVVPVVTETKAEAKKETKRDLSLDEMVFGKVGIFYLYGFSNISGVDNQGGKGTLLSTPNSGVELFFKQFISDSWSTQLTYTQNRIEINPELSSKVLLNQKNILRSFSFSAENKMRKDQSVPVTVGVSVGKEEALFYRGMDLVTYKVNKVPASKATAHTKIHFVENSRMTLDLFLAAGIFSPETNDYYNFKTGTSFYSGINLSQKLKHFFIEQKLFYRSNSASTDQVKFKNTDIGFMMGVSLPIGGD